MQVKYVIQAKDENLDVWVDTSDEVISLEHAMSIIKYYDNPYGCHFRVIKRTDDVVG